MKDRAALATSESIEPIIILNLYTLIERHALSLLSLTSTMDGETCLDGVLELMRLHIFITVRIRSTSVFNGVFLPSS